MGHTHYNSAFKTVAVLMQMVFLIVVIIMFSLLINSYETSMFLSGGRGTGNFSESGYYSWIEAGMMKMKKSVFTGWIMYLWKYN